MTEQRKAPAAFDGPLGTCAVWRHGWAQNLPHPKQANCVRWEPFDPSKELAEIALEFLGGIVKAPPPELLNAEARIGELTERLRKMDAELVETRAQRGRLADSLKFALGLWHDPLAGVPSQMVGDPWVLSVRGKIGEALEALRAVGWPHE